MMKVKGFPDYFILPNGDLYTTRNVRTTKSGDPIPKKMKGYTDKNGFVRHVLLNNAGRFTKYAHNLVMEHYGTNIHPHKVVTFKDGDPKNLNIKNLEQVTRSELIKRHKGKDKKKGLTKRMKRLTKLQPKSYGKKINVQGRNAKPKKNP